MSFILDALKKSENERQRTIGPSLADAPVRRQQGDRPWWAVAVAALLVVNLAVLMIVLTRNDSPTSAAPVANPVAPPVSAAPAPAAYASTPAPASQPTRAAANPAVRSLAEEAGAYADSDYAAADATGAQGHPDLAAAASIPDGPSIVRPIDAPAVAPLPAGATFESRSVNGSAANREVLPTASSLTASGTSLPEMRLDIHVYSNNPAERFVFVNMRKYLEGQVLNEGPTVERITPDGAILNNQGLRFLLPRQ